MREKLKFIMNKKIIIGAIIGGILSTIKTTRAYQRAIKIIGRNRRGVYLDPYVAYIALHSPLTLVEANQVYTVAQAYGISTDCIIEYACQMRGDVEGIIRKFEHS